ncbi:AraC-like DNA-binding protein [Anaerobacterium chartisolvens]|uniref:AraC-like DNA-binding protein n=1 Tax=Anaerobacterium chartisolvens TaxID=1297424 RepID=A0A369AZB6_9FIRM|nr:AraC family transcriptional regulator [Anaerobacterium chartisolvens]RCX13526.1 AraC-like DNA-binding protein [Anaerobacterium chartisolvens]
MERAYVKTPLNSVLEINKIISLHYFEYVKDFKGIFEEHDFWEIVYVDFGEVEAVADGKHHILQQGQAIFHRPWELHNIYATGSFASVFIVSFDCFNQAMLFFERKILMLNNDERNLIAGILREGRLVFNEPFDIMEQTELIKKPNTVFGAEQMLKTQLEQLLISLTRSAAREGQSTSTTTRIQLLNEQHIVDTVISFLVENVYGSISLDEICMHLSFSKSYIEMLFKKATGGGVIKYFNKIKVNEAKRLISEGKYSFTQIAEMLNFSSIHYFSRIFKQHTCMTPTGYEKSVKARSLL